MEWPQQPANIISSQPHLPDSNPNRETKLLETHASHTKQTTGDTSNRENFQIALAFACSSLRPSLNNLLKLEISATRTKQSTSLFLIDNFCAFFLLRLWLRNALFVFRSSFRGALFASLNTTEEQFS